MKKYSFALKAAAVSVSALVIAGSLAPCASAAERKYSKKDLTAYMFSEDKKDTLSCLIYDDMPSVPYVSFVDYLGKLFDNDFSISEKGNGVYSVTCSTNIPMEIDTAKDTIHCKEFEHFLPIETTDADNDGPEAVYIKKAKNIMKGEVNALDLDYGKYNIDITAVDGKIYFPLTSLSNLFCDTYISAVYLNGEIYFWQTTLPEYFETDEAYSTKPRSKDLIDYSYNDLCFVLDNFFGKPPKSELGKLIKENSGFDAYMNNSELGQVVKPLLMSSNVTDYYIGLLMLDNLLEDGGHSSLSVHYTEKMMDETESDFSKAVTAALEDKNNPGTLVIARVLMNMKKESDDSKALVKLRTDAYSSFENVKTWKNEKDPESGNDAEFYIKNDTAIFVFDEFKDEVVAPFKWSLDYAKEKGAKNFLIDLSQNGGGSNMVVMYMLSIMTGRNDLYTKNQLTGNSVVSTGIVDRNLDNVIDEKDKELDYDFHFALLTSKKSFSCGNLLPCRAQEYQIPVVGETSGGGTCYIMNPSYPNAVTYSLSGFKMMVNGNGEDIENGAKVDFETAKAGEDGNVDYSNLYDIASITAFLDDYYSKVTPTKVLPDVYSTKSVDDSLISTILLIAIPVVIVAAAVLIIVFVIKDKKKKAAEAAETAETTEANESNEINE